MIQGSELSVLSSWQNFYVIIGTAAATLTGLMFVATTLVAGIDTHVETLYAGMSAFNTPTVVHFGAVLLLAGILSAPWQTVFSLKVVLSLFGLSGVLYMLIVWRRMWQVPQYQTPGKDWLWYMVLPLLVYIIIVVAALALTANPALVLYIVSAAMLLLLFLAIHNAWDLVSYLAVERSHSENSSRE